MDYFNENCIGIDYGKTKRLIVILEGETVINNCLAVILFNGIKTAVVHHQTWQSMRRITSIEGHRLI